MHTYIYIYSRCWKTDYSSNTGVVQPRNKWVKITVFGTTRVSKTITGQRKYDIVGKPCSRHWEDNEQIMERRRQRRKRERSRLHTSMEICWYHPRRWLPDQKERNRSFDPHAPDMQVLWYLTVNLWLAILGIHQNWWLCKLVMSTQPVDYIPIICWWTRVLVGHELILVPQITKSGWFRSFFVQVWNM